MLKLTRPKAVAPILTAAAALVALVLFIPAAVADQLIMNNGDIISGTLESVSGTKVTIKPGYGGAITVDRSAVASISTNGEFEVELADGSTVTARLGGIQDGEQVLLVDGKSMVVAPTDVTAAALPKPYYERTSHADLNATFNSGNTDSQSVLLYADTRVRLGDHRHFGSLSFRRDETDGVSTKKQDLLGYEYNWLYSGRWYLGATASYETDPIRDLDHRYTLGALLGRDLLNDGNRFLTISLGTGYTDEEVAGVSDSGSVGLWNLRYEHALFNSRLNFFHNHNLTYQFYGDNNTILKTNSGFRYDILANVYANLAVRYDYETEPAANSSKDDTTMVIGVGATF